jgi:hypothetical protein
VVTPEPSQSGHAIDPVPPQTGQGGTPREASTINSSCLSSTVPRPSQFGQAMVFFPLQREHVGMVIPLIGGYGDHKIHLAPSVSHFLRGGDDFLRFP